MKKIILLTIFLFISIKVSWSQRKQVIAYIDMEYILENVPEYLDAQNTLNAKVTKWRKKLDEQARHIEILKSDLVNEKTILTEDLIEEKEEEITLKQVELRRLESLYFGPKGDMFLVRKQLVKPIQDQVYNAIQGIAKRKKYDFVFDKSSDLVMLFSNKKYDISDLVLSTIDRTRLIDKKKEKKNTKKGTSKKEDAKAKKIADNQSKKKAIADKRKELLKKREEKVLTKKEEAKAKKIADSQAKKKAIADKRKELLKKREEKRKLLREKKEAARKKKEQEKKDN